MVGGGWRGGTNHFGEESVSSTDLAELPESLDFM